MAGRGVPKASQRARVVLYIPEKDASVAATGGEGLVISRDGDVENGVAVCGVALDGGGCCNLGGGGLCARKVDLAVGGASEDVGAAEGGEGEGVDGGGVRC